MASYFMLSADVNRVDISVFGDSAVGLLQFDIVVLVVKFLVGSLI